MELHLLDKLILNLGASPTLDQLNLIYSEFKRDFIDNNLVIDGLKVKVILKKSAVEGFETFPETFVHLITRKGQSQKRTFDRHRANKIHWVRCILEKRTDEAILYFEYPENEKIRNYYWYRSEGFILIMEKIIPDYIIITSFNIDDKQNEIYFEKRYQWYLKNKLKKMPQIR